MDNNLFSGLESMGLGNMSGLDIFGDGKKKEEEKKKVEVKKIVIDEKTLLLNKSFKCPLCDHEFRSKVVKTGKAKLVSQDTDLRPRYQELDAIKYDVIACPACGYAALARLFTTLGSVQGKLIKEKISATFMGLGPMGETYSYDDAIARHKLALVNAVVKRAKVSERAYLCMLIAWLDRGKRETLPAETPNREALSEKLIVEEKEFLRQAKEGFKDAFTKESFPLCGLDEHTATYVIAALSAETGSYEEALRWTSQLITSRNANDRIKERARNLKDMINNKEI